VTPSRDAQGLGLTADAARYLRALLRRSVGPLGHIGIASLRGGRARSPGGRMRAGTRRPSPCRVSIGWAKEDQGGSTEQAHGSDLGGKKASRERDRISGPVA